MCVCPQGASRPVADLGAGAFGWVGQRAHRATGENFCIKIQVRRDSGQANLEIGLGFRSCSKVPMGQNFRPLHVCVPFFLIGSRTLWC
jgi:hypothetical protein